jgi:hypothetical protein
VLQIVSCKNITEPLGLVLCRAVPAYWEYVPPGVPLPTLCTLERPLSSVYDSMSATSGTWAIAISEAHGIADDA